MVHGKWYPMGSDIALPLSLREAVFGRGRDALDSSAWQVVVLEEGQAVGAARLWLEDGAFCLGDIGVLPAYQGRGYGDLLVRLLLFKALTHGASLLRVRPPQPFAAFFERYGFAPDPEGDGWILLGSQVHLDGCAGCRGCS